MNISRSILCVVLLLFAFGQSVSYADDLADRVAYVRTALNELYFGGNSTIPRTGIDGGKCGTPLILEAMSLHSQHGAALGLSEYFQRYWDEELSETFDSPGGHFKIHYTTNSESNHLIDTLYGDHNGNDVPDYAEIVARIADSVWVHHIDELGYHEPLNDADYHWGGDSRYDIYVGSWGADVYGFSQPDTVSPIGNGQQVTSWMAVQTHYETFYGYSNRPIEALQVTIAHEFFHAIHFWYDATEANDPEYPTIYEKMNASWMEISAVWMEEETYDNVNDYYYYLPSYLRNVHKSLTDFHSAGGLHPYGASIFAIYLTERFDRDIIKEIWERCAEEPYNNFLTGAIQGAIEEVSAGALTFEDVWAEFSRWLYFTGDRQPSFFEEGVNYAMIPEIDTVGFDIFRPYIRSYSDFPVQVDKEYSYFPVTQGNNYLVFDVTTLDSVFAIDYFNGTSANPIPIGWRVSIMGYNRFNPTQAVWVADSVYRNKDYIEIRDIREMTDLIVVPTPANPMWKNPAGMPETYRFNAIGEARKINTHDIHSPYPSKFIISDDPSAEVRIRIDLAVDATAYLDVFTVAGEKLYSTTAYGVQNGQVALRWNGRNEEGTEVASGIYILLVRVGDDTETFKVLVIR